MNISLNGLKLARLAEGERTVGEVLAEVAEDVSRGGKIITQVAVDGRVLTANRQRQRLLAAQVDEVQSLDLTIDEPAHLKQQTIQDAGCLVEKLIHQSKPLGRKFRIGDEVGANSELADYLENLKWIIAGLDYSTRLSSGKDGLAELRGRFMDSADRLLPTLDLIYKAQAAGDYIAIADEIEYDLLDLLASWTPLLGQVQQELQSPVQEK